MMVMNMQRGPEWIAASDLVQRTRVLIIERCKRPTNISTPHPEQHCGEEMSPVIHTNHAAMRVNSNGER